jgi:hypothetical protein
MPFTIVRDEGGDRPSFVCNFFGKEIEDAFEGSYEWNVPEGQNKTTDVKFLHNECSRPYEAKYGPTDFNMGIHNLMVYLLNNLRLTPERLKQAYDDTARLSQS